MSRHACNGLSAWVGAGRTLVVRVASIGKDLEQLQILYAINILCELLDIRRFQQLREDKAARGLGRLHHQVGRRTASCRFGKSKEGGKGSKVGLVGHCCRGMGAGW